MIITRSPLRISLGGGGTDLPSYFTQYSGFVISAAIVKYVYVSVIRPFRKGIYLKYSQHEHVERVEEVKHPIIREALLVSGLDSAQIEITTLADIPAGTGLGSSGSFTTALLKGLYAYQRRHLHQEELAEKACYIEIDRLREPIGKQDQYIAAVGGISCFDFHPDGRVSTTPLNITRETLYKLEDNLLLFYTGFTRSASAILEEQNKRTLDNDSQMVENLHYVKDMGYRSKQALEAGDTNGFGQLMNEHWSHKKRRSFSVSNDKIDSWYDLGLANGAIGGKVVGAGGGGFLLFYASDAEQLRRVMAGAGLEEVRFHFDFEGTKVVLS